MIIKRTEEGVIHKPSHCKLCKLQYKGSGFCSDYVNIEKKPKMMLLLEQPFKSDIVNQYPLSGDMGNWFEWKVMKPLGIERKDLLICHVLRCHLTDYPEVSLRRSAENTCRFYDDEIRRFDPELFVYTYGIQDTFGDPAFLALMIEDLKKGLRFVDKGDRVCMLMGRNSVAMFDNVPFMEGKGGLKQFRGNFKYGKWNY